MDDKTLHVIDEQGNEIDYEIVMTFKSEQTGYSYVIYKEFGDSDEVFASRYNEDDEDGGELMAIESDEEWDMVEEVLETFLAEEDDE